MKHTEWLRNWLEDQEAKYGPRKLYFVLGAALGALGSWIIF